MYFYFKTYRDGLYEGQELGIEQHIIEPKIGEQYILQHEDLTPWGEGTLALEIKVVDCDDTSITFKTYNQKEKTYKEPQKISIGETVECEVVTILHYDGYNHYSTEEFYFYLDKMDVLFDVSVYRDIEIYEELFEKFPEYKDKLLAKILKEGNIYIKKRIYERGLFGIEKDDLHVFCYLVTEPNFDRFMEWYHLPEVQKDLKNMDTIKPNEDIMNLKAEFDYWIARYLKDHNDNECLSMYKRPLKFFIRDGYYEDISYTQYLSARDVVMYVVDNNLYDTYENLELEFNHGTSYENLTLWIVYGCYLHAIEYLEKTGKASNDDIYIDVPERDYKIAFNISWSAPRKYIDKDMALAYVREAANKCDRYAKALLEHYGL